MASFNNALKKVFSGQANWHEPDWKLMATVALLLVFGLIMLSSASAVVSYNKFHDSYYFLKKQLFSLGFGLVAFWFFASFDYHRLRKYALPLLVMAIFSLTLVFIPGLQADWGSSRSWIQVFGYSFQPSELVKPFFLLYLAAWLEGRGKKLNVGNEGIVPFVVLLGIITALLIAQPDIGTLSIIALTSLVVYYVGGGKLKHIFAIISVGALGLIVSITSQDYQLQRFKCLANPSYSANHICYQVNQSLIAVGSGGWFGRGLGESRQKFFYLPEVQADAIFPIIGEEVGFLFSGALIVLFAYFFYRGYFISRRAPDTYGMILSIGIVTWISFQFIVNVGGMINLLPITGVPLPFISYGGSALLTSLIAMGILINISRQTKLNYKS